jgi:hypothetical protein
MSEQHPAPGSPEELAAYAKLQHRIADLYHALGKDARTPQTVVVVPSLSMDPRELRRSRGSTTTKSACSST